MEGWRIANIEGNDLLPRKDVMTFSTEKVITGIS
jgi:hypothetical protein